MKLVNRNPAMFVGRTIIHRHQAWKIQSVSADTIYLIKPAIGQKGQLRLNQFAECRLFQTREEVIAQFPKLIRAIGRVCKLSQIEAAVAIRGMLTTGSYYMDSEAIALLGGSGRAVTLAFKGRNKKRR
jgi:hypothetical protein